MKRNKEVRVEYSRKNPPPNIEVAIYHKAGLETTIQSIEAQLRNMTPYAYNTPKQYLEEKHRKEEALHYRTVEIQFLEEWLLAKSTTLMRNYNPCRNARGLQKMPIVNNNILDGLYGTKLPNNPCSPISRAAKRERERRYQCIIDYVRLQDRLGVSPSDTILTKKYNSCAKQSPEHTFLSLELINAISQLVSANRLRLDDTDAGPRLHLGRADTTTPPDANAR